MRIARLQLGSQVLLVEVWADGEGARPMMVDEGSTWSDPLREYLSGGRLDEDGWFVTVSSGDLLSPVRAPRSLIGAVGNYGSSPEALRTVFAKSPGSIGDPDGTISWPSSFSGEVDYEGELAVIVGRRLRDVDAATANAGIFGYTIANDVTARDVQRSDEHFYLAKSFDSFCPLGPFIVTAEELSDASDLRIVTKVNGEVRQDCATSRMAVPPAKLLSTISRYVTLEPGDVVLTGTPPGCGRDMDPPHYLQDGDVVEITIDPIGTLRSTVHLA
jgi:2-keto-4-pentenoate hydratase/2-oxohepta-3-ene-1,7-dioic acid hydratase in catechol pathway